MARDAKQTWTEAQDKLLFAAQAVVSDGEPRVGRPLVIEVDSEVFAELVAAVRRIHEDAVEAIYTGRL